MNKKQLIIAAMATALSVSAVHASNISGFSQTSGTFNIDPAKVNGDVGYRSYDNFTLSKGDIANLIYRYKSGTASQRDIETFINLVQNKIDINGIVNSVRDGSFHPGHAVFISPNGLAVGSSGVINVGTLSVATPTSTTFSKLQREYTQGDFTNINQVSKLKQSGNAPITVDGYIFAQNGIDLPGNNINVSGNVVNGMTNQSKMTSLSQAEALFNQLVNTDGTIKANSSVINSNGSLVFLHQTGSTGGINVSGNVVNLTQGTAKNGSVAITNNGSNGLTMTGNVAANGKLSLYNKSGDMQVAGNLYNRNGELSVTNSENASNLTISSGSKIKNSTADINVVNNGSGTFSNAGSLNAAGVVSMTNAAGKGMTISGDTTASTIRIINRGDSLVFSGTADADTSVSVRNYGKSGMTLNGTIKADEGVLVDNKAGDAVINGKISVVDGNVAVMNRATAGALKTGANSNITVGTGKLVLKNAGSNGMDLNGKLINNDGETAINNLAGSMKVAGTIDNKDGNMGIVNKGTGKMAVDATINNNGRLKVANINGNGLEINGEINNEGDKFTVYNEKGQLTVNGKLTNDGDYLYVLSRKNSEGIVTGEDSLIAVKDGDLAIKHNGKYANAQGYGMDLNGAIVGDVEGEGQVAINNYKGDMHVGGAVAAGNDTGIINRAGGEDMVVDAIIVTDNDVTNIKNDGSGDMTLGGLVTHSGRLNVLGNEGQLTVDGDVINIGEDMTYIASRKNGTGITVTENSEISSADGLVLIKNITGKNGLEFNGSIKATNAQTELYNKKGDMKVNGTITGEPAVVLNTGDGLTVTDNAELGNSYLLVNKGSKAANVSAQYKADLKEKLK